MAALVRRVPISEIKNTSGTLIVAEERSHVPFEIKRVFAICDVAAGAARGKHAHRAQHQFLIIPAGGVVVTVDDGKRRWREDLNCRNEALYVPPLIWLELEDFAPASTCLVLASGVYDESDYIRDYAEFTRIARAE